VAELHFLMFLFAKLKKNCGWEVLSGIGLPQGSVLGPLSFLILINDLADGIMSRPTILKFADDTKIFSKVTNTIDGLRTVAAGPEHAL